MALSKESAATDFVRDAFGHFKAIGIDSGKETTLSNSLVAKDHSVIDASDPKALVAAAKTLQRDREPLVRTLA